MPKSFFGHTTMPGIPENPMVDTKINYVKNDISLLFDPGEWRPSWIFSVFYNSPMVRILRHPLSYIIFESIQ